MTRFERHVAKQVLDFLQTVLMIDDEAYRRAPQRGDSTDEWDDDFASTQHPVRLELQAPPHKPSQDELDVNEVSFRFASEGLACAVLSPQSSAENDRIKPAFVETAMRADALILDWNMNGDDGKTAERLIEAVLERDLKTLRRRLRLIMIYTGEPDIAGIAQRVASTTIKSLADDALCWDDDRMVAFVRGPLRVAVFAKEHVQNLHPELSDRRRSASALPGAVVDEFSMLTMGLVTTAALSALAGIRNDAHRVIAALGPQLDAAVLGQRVSLPHPEDVERQVESLIVAEVRAIVEDHQAGRHISLPRIKEWLQHHTQLAPRGISSAEFVTDDLRYKLLATGFGDSVLRELKASKVPDRQVSKLQKTGGTEMFSSSEEERAASDRLFASRMSIRSRYSNPRPVLGLGSILMDQGQYWICVQPACDSVRIPDVRAFPLLPLQVAKERDGYPGDGLLTVPDDQSEGGYVRLRVRAKPASIRMETFAAGGEGVVRARVRSGKSTFKSETGRRWRWVCDLQSDHAQRVIERLSAQFSRVGLDEAETLRQGF